MASAPTAGSPKHPTCPLCKRPMLPGEEVFQINPEDYPAHRACLNQMQDDHEARDDDRMSADDYRNDIE